MSLVRFSSRNHPQQTVRRKSQAEPLFELSPLPVGASDTDDVDDRATDPVLFAVLDRRFGFTVDVAAAAHNTQCARYYDRERDGLAQSWTSERVWCNPPYSDVRPWVAKAHAEIDAQVIVMLLPANRTEQSWWQDLVEPHRDRGGSLRTEFLRGRQRFIMPGCESIEPNQRPPFGCVLLIWGER